MRGRPLIALLGAGQSQRFGSADKLSAPLGGLPLGAWGLAAALACPADVIWIYGAHMPGFLPPEIEAIANPNWADGMGASIACAAHTARRRHASALVILPADMPFVTPDVLGDLIACAGPAACRYPDGQVGVPARFDPDQYDALIGGDMALGAGAILRANATLHQLTVPDLVLSDVDTPEDLGQAEIWCQTGAVKAGRNELGKVSCI